MDELIRQVTDLTFGNNTSNINIGMHNIFKSHYSRRQKDDMRQIPNWGPTNIKRHRTKFICPGYLAAGFVHACIATTTTTTTTTFKSNTITSSNRSNKSNNSRKTQRRTNK